MINIVEKIIVSYKSIFCWIDKEVFHPNSTSTIYPGSKNLLEISSACDSVWHFITNSQFLDNPSCPLDTVNASIIGDGLFILSSL